VTSSKPVGLPPARAVDILQTPVTVCLRLEYVKPRVQRWRIISARPDDDLVRRPGPARRALVVHL
jgi:hypothetical protein